MSPDENALLSSRDEAVELGIERSLIHDYAMLEELSFVRYEAQVEADLAYEDWCYLRSRDAYAVYRAAQDRADAAQDDLAQLARRVA